MYRLSFVSCYILSLVQRQYVHYTILTNSPYIHTHRIAAFEESLKDWNPRPEIPDEPCEETPDWMDDIDNLGPRVVKSAEKTEVKQSPVNEAMRNVKRGSLGLMPKAIKINSKRWSTKDGSVKAEPRDELSTVSSQKNKPISSVEVLPKQEIPEYKDEKCKKSKQASTVQVIPKPEVPAPKAEKCEKKKPASSVEVTPKSEIPGPKTEECEKNKPASTAEVAPKPEVPETKAEKCEKNKPVSSAEVTSKPEVPESKAEKYKNSKSASNLQVTSKPVESKADKREESLDTKSSATCDIDPPVEEYFSEDRPRSKRNKSAESSAPVEIKSELDHVHCRE